MIRVTIETEDGIDIVELDADEQKAFEFSVLSVKRFLREFIYNQVRHGMIRIVDEYSDRQGAKVTRAERKTIVHNATVKSAKERADEFEAERENN